MSKRNRRPITDTEVENEIAALRDDPDVKLSQLERQLKIKRGGISTTLDF